MIRYLTEREPSSDLSAWFVSKRSLCIRDVLLISLEAWRLLKHCKLIEIGGPTRLTYAGMLLGYAKESGSNVCSSARHFMRRVFRLLGTHGHTHPLARRVPADEGRRARLIVRDERLVRFFQI